MSCRVTPPLSRDAAPSPRDPPRAPRRPPSASAPFGSGRGHQRFLWAPRRRGRPNASLSPLPPTPGRGAQRHTPQHPPCCRLVPSSTLDRRPDCDGLDRTDRETDFQGTSRTGHLVPRPRSAPRWPGGGQGREPTAARAPDLVPAPGSCRTLSLGRLSHVSVPRSPKSREAGSLWGTRGRGGVRGEAPCQAHLDPRSRFLWPVLAFGKVTERPWPWFPLL